jgi:hypothetical protein
MDRLNDCANTTEAEAASLRKDNERLRAELAEAKGARRWGLHPWVKNEPDPPSWGVVCFLHGIVSFSVPMLLAGYYVFLGPTPEIMRAAMVVPPITASWFIAWVRREVAK